MALWQLTSPPPLLVPLFKLLLLIPRILRTSFSHSPGMRGYRPDKNPSTSMWALGFQGGVCSVMRRRWLLLLRGMELDCDDEDCDEVDDLVEDRGRLGADVLLLASTLIVVATRTRSPRMIDVNPSPCRGGDVRGRGRGRGRTGMILP
jgi:hypothetical protein